MPVLKLNYTKVSKNLQTINMLDIENIALTLREGKPILVFDETDREGETDIFFFS